MTVASELSRARAVHGIGLLDTPPEERFDRIVRLAQLLFDVPMAAVNFVDRERVWSKAAVGVPVRESRREGSPCAATVGSSGVTVVPDTAHDDRFRHLTAQGVGFYAGQPLRNADGERVGALCILDHVPRTFTSAQAGQLRELADWVEAELLVQADLAGGAAVQRGLLPQQAPVVPGYQVAGACVPAREISGDFYDFYLAAGQLHVTVADVMGKGVGAAILAAGARSLLRGASRFNDLLTAVERAAFSMEQDLLGAGSFITLLAARLDPATGLLRYVDAGHGLAIVLSATGVLRRLASDGLPLGVVSGDVWTEQSTVLEPGETFIVFSDGILDTVDTLEDVLPAAVPIVLECPTAADVVARVERWVRRRVPADDVTVVVIRREAQ